ncbi:MAG: vitamin K epoxide reductase family protein [Gammaproteobacteria bacterium]|nr:vitamin K epoxide reductase family protein [Gammaproteobacteria bacterium]
MKKKRKKKLHRENRTTEHKPGHGAKQAAATHPIKGVHLLLLILVFCGLALTAYITATRWFGTVPLACSDGSDCDLVQSSRWSTLFGLPISFWGFLTYGILLKTIWRMRKRRLSWRFAWVITFVSVGISTYLTAISLFVIEAICIYCLTSFGLMLAIFAILSMTRPDPMPDFQWRTWLPGTALATVAVVAGLQIHYSGIFDPAAGPEKPYLKALAMHLEKSGAKFYGAYWCQNCQEQKSLFEASAHRLPYVECTPDGRNGIRDIACLTRNIQRYPTWIINNQRYELALKPDSLARYSKFRWSKEKAADTQ